MSKGAIRSSPPIVIVRRELVLMIGTHRPDAASVRTVLYFVFVAQVAIVKIFTRAGDFPPLPSE